MNRRPLPRGARAARFARAATAHRAAPRTPGAPLRLAALIASIGSGLAGAQPVPLQPSPALATHPGPAAAAPAWLTADQLRVRPDLDAEAQGDVRFERAGTAIEADQLRYDVAEDTATADGHVRITTPQARYRGRTLQLQVQRFEGYFLSPEFDLTVLGAGGSAGRIDFLDPARSTAQDVRYSSCPRDGGVEPDWVLTADRLRIDQGASEGVAEGAVLRFLGVPILGLPVLSFPLSDARRSGWLPPTFVPVNSRNGMTLGVPYYWNIAPERDATITPLYHSRLGLGVEGEARFLAARDSGRFHGSWLPHDPIADRGRGLWRYQHQGALAGGLRYSADWLRVSDDDYWKDFSGTVPSTTPRLLSGSLAAERPLALGWATGLAYARVQHWQVLQTGVASEAIDSPYQRTPQIGLQLQPRLPEGWRAQLQTELNRFDRPDDSGSSSRPTGWRWHGVAQLGRAFGDRGLWVTPRLRLNAAAYQLDQDLAQRHLARAVPTLSLELGAALERRGVWFGRAQHQILEPRLLYVRTPWREQSDLPLFDTAERDFNTVSIFSDSIYTGPDRIADANLLTAGAITRWVDDRSGVETLRLGIAQRFRFTPQRVTLDGSVQDRRLSDVLVDGSTALLDPWRLDAALQYNPDNDRIVRSVLRARYNPAPFHTLSFGYRLARGLSEQVELGWQWPVYRGKAQPVGASHGCGGTLYAVGRVNYNLLDSRTTDTLAGVEYDAGCWVGRIVARRTSTGSSQSSTQLMVQLELVGLSRLGANPLQALKDNIPGYQLLRERGSTAAPFLDP